MELETKNELDNQGTSATPKVLVMIGANTGGPAALGQIITKIPRNLPACIVVLQQMRPGFTTLLAGQLNLSSSVPVREADNGHPLHPGEVLMVPGGYGARVVCRETFKGMEFRLELEDLSQSPEKQRSKIDRLMHSAVESFGASTVGVLLTGMGDDGREGLGAIRAAGGTTIIQDEASSVLFDMPKAALDAGVVDEVLPLYSMADKIIELVGESNAEFLQKAAG